MKDGDIFHWKWSDPDRDNRAPYGDYHCKSQIAVFENGKLFDTFWGSSPTDNSYLQEDEVTLTLLGNKNDLEVLSDQEEYYDPSDLIVMRHSNDSRAKTLVKPGASRSKQKMREVLLYKVAEAEQKIRSAQADLRHLAVAEYKLENENISKLYF